MAAVATIASYLQHIIANSLRRRETIVLDHPRVLRRRATAPRLQLRWFYEYLRMAGRASFQPVFAVLWQPFQKSAAIHLGVELIDDFFIERFFQEFDLQHFSKIPRHEFCALPAVNFSQKKRVGPIMSRYPVHVSSSFLVKMPLLQKS